MSIAGAIKSTDPEEGTITYNLTPEAVAGIQGFFSFTFYIRDSLLGEQIAKTSELYLKGILAYTKLLNSDVFGSFKVLVYTDAYTYKEIEKTRGVKGKRGSTAILYELCNEFLKEVDNGNIIYGIVQWPNHQRRLGVEQINGPALRTMRSRAPFDFPDKYFFIRDADTLFEKTLDSVDTVYGMTEKDFLTLLFTWEATVLQNITSISEQNGNIGIIAAGCGFVTNPHIVGGKMLYQKSWHKNEISGLVAPFGIFAGFVTITPGVPVYQNYSVWDNFVDYLNVVSKRMTNSPHTTLEAEYRRSKQLGQLNVVTKENLEAYGSSKIQSVGAPYQAMMAQQLQNKAENIYYDFSNNAKDTKIGRDEQLYLLFILPNSLDNLIFYKITLGDSDPPAFDPEFHAGAMEKYKAFALFGQQEGGKQKKRVKNSKRKTRKSKY